jgi:acyl-CoA dehydrogenase
VIDKDICRSCHTIHSKLYISSYSCGGRRRGALSSEAFAEIRKQRLLGIHGAPQALGGEGASIAEIADVCYILGQACSSTALIYAMHQIKMACIVRHTKGNAALERILRASRPNSC